MRAEDHPNHTTDVPMLFPPAVERLQIKYVNPAMRPFAKRLPGFTIIKHTGRTSGTPYETIVTSYRKGNVFAVLLAHGKTNWVKNVLAAGEADARLLRRKLHLVNPRILPVGSDGTGLPLIPRLAVRSVGVFVADIA